MPGWVGVKNATCGHGGRESSESLLQTHRSTQAVNTPKEHTDPTVVATLKDFSGILFLFKNKLKSK